jgi:hypothetical protein
VFEEYLSDSSHFILEARLVGATDVDASRRLYRVSAMVGLAAMETFANFIGSVLSEAGARGLEGYELGLLLDKRFGQNNGKFQMFDQVAYSRLEDKLRFLVEKFGVAIDFVRTPEWSQFLDFKHLRDDLVHSRAEADERTLEEYDAACVRGLRATLALMDAISLGVFKRSLRRGLHDVVDLPTR